MRPRDCLLEAACRSAGGCHAKREHHTALSFKHNISEKNLRLLRRGSAATLSEGLQHGLQELHQLLGRVLALLSFGLPCLFSTTGTCGFSAAGSTFDAINNSLYLAEDISDSAASTACATSATAATRSATAFAATE